MSAPTSDRMHRHFDERAAVAVACVAACTVRRAAIQRGMAGTDHVTLHQLLEILPPRVWYLTSNGQDMWCRRPYGFLFSTGEAAEAFARAMGTGEALFAIGLDVGAVVSDELLGGLRDSAVTRIFVDPAIDPDSGDVHGQILRLAPMV
jgi:hypothetical protein